MCLCSSTSIALISSVLILGLGTAVAFAYTGMQGLVARFQRQGFERGFVEAQFLLNTAGPNDRHLAAGLVKARGLFDRLPVSESSARPTAGWFARLTEAEQRRVREELVELMMLEARARVRLASRPGRDSESQEAIRRAIDRLNLAARIDDHVPAALFDERADYHAALGDAALADRDRKRAAAVQPDTCHDWTLLGRTLLVGGDPAAAEVALRRALRLDCTSLWAWFMMGHCHYAQGRFIEAAGDFSACSVQGSQFAWVHFNRGLALARAGFLESARDAYDLALTTDPDFTRGTRQPRPRRARARPARTRAGRLHPGHRAGPQRDGRAGRPRARPSRGWAARPTRSASSSHCWPRTPIMRSSGSHAP